MTFKTLTLSRIFIKFLKLEILRLKFILSSVGKLCVGGVSRDWFHSFIKA